MKQQKMSLSEIPAIVLTFVFIALIGGVGMIILASFQASSTDANVTGFITNSKIGINAIGDKLGLLGTIVILSVIIGLVLVYFAVGRV